MQMLTSIFVHDHQSVFILAVIVLSLSVFVLRTKPLFFIGQLAIFGALFLTLDLNLMIVFFALSVVQALLGLYLLYHYKKIADRDYILVLEKTHFLRPNLTKGGRAGI